MIDCKRIPFVLLEYNEHNIPTHCAFYQPIARLVWSKAYCGLLTLTGFANVVIYG
jgi:hypothetical protein